MDYGPLQARIVHGACGDRGYNYVVNTTASSTNQNNASVPDTRTLCVLWHAPGAVLDPRLLAALRRPDVHLETCDSCFDAVRLLTTHATRDAALGMAHRVLLLAEPAELPRAEEVATLAPRFAEHVVYWVYESRATEHVRVYDLPALVDKLRGISPNAQLDPTPHPDATTVEAASEGGVVRSQRTPGTRAAMLRLADTGIATQASDASRPASTPRTQILSDAEIAMLLDDS